MINAEQMNSHTGLSAGLPSAADYEEKLKLQAERERPWSKCTAEEKLDRLRNELLAARHLHKWEQQRFSRIDEKLRHFEFHQHGTDGTVMVRARDMERGYGEVAGQIEDGFDPLA